MKLFSKVYKSRAVLLGGILALVLAGSVPASAVPPEQVFVTLVGKTVSGPCCFSFDDSVKVTEPATVVPVIVTWSTEQKTDGLYLAGLSVNGGPCTAYGSRTLQQGLGSPILKTMTMQWVIKPSDGLVQGSNIFTVCGGEASEQNHALTIGLRTLTAQLGK